MEPGEDAVLPGVILGAVFGEDDAAGSVAQRVEVWAQLRVRDKGSEIDPRFVAGKARANVEALIGPLDFDSRLCGAWAGRVHGGSAGNGFGSRVDGRLVEGEEGEKIGELLLVETLHALWHHGELARARVFDVVA